MPNISGFLLYKCLQVQINEQKCKVAFLAKGVQYHERAKSPLKGGGPVQPVDQLVALLSFSQQDKTAIILITEAPQD